MFQAIPTLAGQAAIAAAINDEGDLTIAEMVVGDGNGAATTPLETQGALVNQRSVIPISSSVRDGNKVVFEAVLGEAIGPFTIREAGLLDPNGLLLFVASIAPIEKLSPAQGVSHELTLGVEVIVSDTANVSLQPPPGSLISIADMLRAPWMSVESMTLTTPPTEPIAGATYRVPPSATGAWVGHTHELTQWNGSVWVFKAVPTTHVVGEVSTGRFWERTASGWAERWIARNRVSRAHLHFSGCM